jgi:hypothetical protein
MSVLSAAMAKLNGSGSSPGRGAAGGGQPSQQAVAALQQQLQELRTINAQLQEAVSAARCRRRRCRQRLT